MESKQLYVIQNTGKCQIEETKKYNPNERMEQYPEKELSKMEIANLSDAEFKTLMIRMLRDVTKYGKHIREEMKTTLSEIKKNPQGTNSEGKEARVQIDDLEHKEEINTQPEQNEQTRFFFF